MRWRSRACTTRSNMEPVTRSSARYAGGSIRKTLRGSTRMGRTGGPRSRARAPRLWNRIRRRGMELESGAGRILYTGGVSLPLTGARQRRPRRGPLPRVAAPKEQTHRLKR